ncbi:hypothetical protein Hypma_000496 [Hypsizygus marmoreus]|uniref:Uncharacterized protein n=1 Tax=Hypsizygus marmoreus TaxID=39966 RepID=A0A369JCH5_HYPMA|nr:hypothetical protein Hypma_000496 [Hypsizygus marmoreus]
MEALLSQEERAAISSAASHNDLLSDSLETTLDLLIADNKRSIVQLDDEIIHVQNILDGRRNQRMNHIAHIRQYQTLLAPHRTLPVDLLEEIFVRCSPQNAIIPYQTPQTPWTLIQVCSKWRQVALALPTLWSNIKMQYYPRESLSACLRNGIRLMGMLFSRSANLPVSLDAAIRVTSDVDDYACEFDQLLVSNAARLRHFQFSGSPSCITSFISLPPSSMQSLHTLVLNQIEFPGTTPFFRGNIQNNTGFQVAVPPATSLFDMPFPKLKDLALAHFSMDSDVIYDILSRCTSLVNCELRLIAHPGQLVRYNRMSTLSKLKKMEVWTTGPLIGFQWIQRLILSDLIDFNFNFFGLSTPDTWPSAWTPALIRSGHLQNLVLRIFVSQLDLEEILAASPLLLNLEISDGMPISEALLHRMSHGELVPKLSSLTCRVENINSLPAHLDMLENRSKINDVTQIEKVTFRVDNHRHRVVGGAVMDRILRLITEGQDIRLLP